MNVVYMKNKKLFHAVIVQEHTCIEGVYFTIEVFENEGTNKNSKIIQTLPEFLYVPMVSTDLCTKNIYVCRKLAKAQTQI